MEEHILIGLTSVFLLGIGAQAISWRFQIPSILLLFLFGFLAGITDLVNPDLLLGDLLKPLVSVSVAIILFEGGLTLKLDELRESHKVVRNMLTIGTLTNLVIMAVAAHYILRFDWPLSLLLGAIFVVTGPTVIGPILQQVRLQGEANSILKWEGILIDPIGATMALLVFESIVAQSFASAASTVILGVVNTVLVAVVMGVAGAVALISLIRYRLVPDTLHNLITLALVIFAYTVSDLIQAESGLLTTTIMGVILANQTFVAMQHIVEFKENIRTLLISTLFILLAARLEISDFTTLPFRSLFFLLVLIFIARPVSVLISTWRSTLTWQEKTYLALMAPRGIVAAAVVSITALRLTEAGHEGAEVMMPVGFMIIAGSILFYGLISSPLARLLKLSHANPQGVLILGAHGWARQIAKTLQEQGTSVMLLDTNPRNVSNALKMELPAEYCSILSDYVSTTVDMTGIGYLLTLTSNDELNSLATMRFAKSLGGDHVYQLQPDNPGSNQKKELSIDLRGRILFENSLTYAAFSDLYAAGHQILPIKLSETFHFENLQEEFGENVRPLFVADSLGGLSIVNTEVPIRPAPFDTLIALVHPAAIAAVVKHSGSIAEMPAS